MQERDRQLVTKLDTNLKTAEAEILSLRQQLQVQIFMVELQIFQSGER